MFARWAAAPLIAALLAVPAHADPVAEFYKGKQINLIVGFGPGGGYDIYARVLARHLGRFIPGHPNIVVQAMPGAGSLRAANYLYNIAPKDGTAIPFVSIGAGATRWFTNRPRTTTSAPSSGSSSKLGPNAWATACVTCRIFTSGRRPVLPATTSSIPRC